MPSVSTSRTIRAPRELVFRAVADVREFKKIQPQIVEVEFLTEQQRGLGTRFRETRMMGSKPATTVLEVTEYVENERIRFVTDAGGTIWDTVMDVRPSVQPGVTELSMVMDARPHKLLAKVMTPLIMGMVGKAVKADMDRVKDWCEAQPR